MAAQPLPSLLPKAAEPSRYGTHVLFYVLQGSEQDGSLILTDTKESVVLS